MAEYWTEIKKNCYFSTYNKLSGDLFLNLIALTIQFCQRDAKISNCIQVNK